MDLDLDIVVLADGTRRATWNGAEVALSDAARAAIASAPHGARAMASDWGWAPGKTLIRAIDRVVPPGPRVDPLDEIRNHLQGARPVHVLEGLARLGAQRVEADPELLSMRTIANSGAGNEAAAVADFERLLTLNAGAGVLGETFYQLDDALQERCVESLCRAVERREGGLAQPDLALEEVSLERWPTWVVAYRLQAELADRRSLEFQPFWDELERRAPNHPLLTALDAHRAAVLEDADE